MTLTERTTMVIAFAALTIDYAQHGMREGTIYLFSAALLAGVTLLQTYMLWEEWRAKQCEKALTCKDCGVALKPGDVQPWCWGCRDRLWRTDAEYRKVRTAEIERAMREM